MNHHVSFLTWIVLLLTSLLLSGCSGWNELHASWARVPVLVGPVKHVGAHPYTEPIKRLVPFSAKAQSTLSSYPYGGAPMTPPVSYNIHGDLVRDYFSSWNSLNDYAAAIDKACGNRGDLAAYVRNIKVESFVLNIIYVYAKERILIDGYSFQPR